MTIAMVIVSVFVYSFIGGVTSYLCRNVFGYECDEGIAVSAVLWPIGLFVGLGYFFVPAH
jgi:hypothetical protein